MMMQDTINDYLFNLKAAGRSPLTIASYQVALKDLVRFLRSHSIQGFRDTSTKDLRVYLASLQAAEFKASTIRTRAIAISCFFNWLVEEELVHTNPMKRVRRPKKPQRKICVFSTAELLGLFAAAERTQEFTRNKTMLYLLLDCGLRVSELLALKSTDYDPTISALTVNGKGSKVRIVRMGERCRQAFESYMARMNGHLWDITREDFSDLVRRLGKRVGIRAHPHKFRHTFACRFLDAGGTIDELQYLMGHSEIGTTMIYAAAGQEARALRSLAKHSPVDNLIP